MAAEWPRREWNGREYIWNQGPLGMSTALAMVDPNDPDLDVTTIGGPLSPIEICNREGHVPTVGLRHDLMRMAMVADCTRCGAVLMLDQRPMVGCSKCHVLFPRDEVESHAQTCGGGA